MTTHLLTGFCVGKPRLNSRVGENLFESMFETGGGVDKKKLGLVLEQQLVVRFHSLRTAKIKSSENPKVGQQNIPADTCSQKIVA